jgi:succinate dehydrogenase / fumarate reductase iron-sulfur subunit
VKVTLKIWRQPDSESAGAMATYQLDEVSEDMSFLEMLDVLNEELLANGEEPVAFDSDCREGICGMCGLMINGRAHGPEVTTTCQLHMRSFEDGDEIVIEPWRADPFPVIKDLVVDRRAFDRIIASGGYISVSTGAAPDAHAVPVPRDKADRAFDAATCIGYGACVAACPNGSASLFLGAKDHPPRRAAAGSGRARPPGGPDGRPARRRGLRRLHQHRRVQRRLPQEIPLDVIFRLNWDLFGALRHGH